MSVVSAIGTHTKTGKVLVAAVLPHTTKGVIYLTPQQHTALCVVLNKYYPMAAGESHKGKFVFGSPVVII